MYMFQSNFSCLFVNRKSSKVQPIKKIQVWENKKVIHTVEFDDISKYKCKNTNNNKLKAKKVF
jgi:hypothetical protein